MPSLALPTDHIRLWPESDAKQHFMEGTGGVVELV
jgi:hypothetical protein